MTASLLTRRQAAPGMKSKCVDCNTSFPIADMVPNEYGAGYRCQKCHADSQESYEKEFGKDASVKTSATREDVMDILDIPSGGKKVYTIGSSTFVVYFDSEEARGDLGGSVPGMISGDYEVMYSPDGTGDPVGGKIILRQHVSPGKPRGTQQYYAAEQCVNAILKWVNSYGKRGSARTASKKLIKKVEGEKGLVRVYYISEDQEYTVVPQGGNEESTYFTTDKQDALDTAETMAGAKKTAAVEEKQAHNDYPSEYDDAVNCAVCGKDVDDCICPECPTCHIVGDPMCYEQHGMERTTEQVKSLADAMAAQADNDARMSPDWTPSEPVVPSRSIKDIHRRSYVEQHQAAKRAAGSRDVILERWVRKTPLNPPAINEIRLVDEVSASPRGEEKHYYLVETEPDTLTNASSETLNDARRYINQLKSKGGEWVKADPNKRGSKKAHRLNVGDVITCSQCGHPLYSDNSKVKDPASYGTPLSHYDNIVCDSCHEDLSYKPVDTESDAPSFNDTTNRWASSGHPGAKARRNA